MKHLVTQLSCLFAEIRNINAMHLYSQNRDNFEIIKLYLYSCEIVKLYFYSKVISLVLFAPFLVTECCLFITATVYGNVSNVFLLHMHQTYVIWVDWSVFVKSSFQYQETLWTDLALWLLPNSGCPGQQWQGWEVLGQSKLFHGTGMTGWRDWSTGGVFFNDFNRKQECQRGEPT